MSEFTNHGKKWTVKETKQLLKEARMLNDKTTNLNNIALVHKRTPYAIYMKLVKEASKIADEDYDINLEELSEIVGLKPNNLLAGFKKIKYDFVVNDEDIENDDSDYEDDNNEEEKEVSDDNNSQKKVMPTYICIIVIVINLAGWYYYMLKAKLI